MRSYFVLLAALFSSAASAQTCVAPVCNTVPSFVGAYFGAAAGSGSVAATQTLGTINNYTVADTAIAMLNSGGGSGNAWARYTLGVITPGSSGRLIDEENSLVNQGPVVAGRAPYNWNPVTNTNLLIDCGNGQANEHECGTALAIAPNTQQYKTGIVFANGALEAGAAIGMPVYDYIWWEAPDGSSAWLQQWPSDFHIHSSGMLTLDVGSVNVKGTMAVSCFGPPTPFFTVNAGLVTHC